MSADLSHITGSCARCGRTDLTSADFVEAHLREFLAEQTAARDKRGFVDARADIRTATKRVEVAGARLFCKPCVEAERSQAAAADTAWNEGDEIGSRLPGAETRPATSCSSDQQQEVVADSWEDDL